MKLNPGLVLPLLMLAACVDAPEEETGIRLLSLNEVQALLPGQGPATFPGTADRYVMVDPNADCRRTLGVSQCALYIDPPNRLVAHNAVPPGDAQIRAGNGGDGRISGSAAVPVGALLRPDGTLIPLSVEGAAVPVAMISPVGAAPLANSRPISVTPAVGVPSGAVPAGTASPSPSKATAPPTVPAKHKKTSPTPAPGAGKPAKDTVEEPTVVIPATAPQTPASQTPTPGPSSQKGPIGGKPFPAVPPGSGAMPVSSGAPAKLSPALTP
jgi:hypothetical protein